MDAGLAAEAGMDAGSPVDAGASMDAGSFPDAGQGLEAGMPADAGAASDSGGSGSSTDAGEGPDASPNPPANPPANCLEVLTAGDTANGFRLIDPDGPGGLDPFITYCLQRVEGGGWTVLANNNNADTEPDGCIPKLASEASLLCPPISPTLDDDHNGPAWTLPFTEMIWVAYENTTLVPLAYRHFRWNTAQTIPNTATWQLIPDDPDGDMPSYDAAGATKISCNWQNASGLVAVFNGNPKSNEAFSQSHVLTFFDQDTDPDNTGKMGFFGTDPGDDLSGLDDFQDGWGCGDDWQPFAHQGASSMIAVR
jgi:hypothetical protein